ncbi:hypothetical protein NBRC116592_23860 [Colwellia sp. KU-HH00111]
MQLLPYIKFISGYLPSLSKYSISLLLVLTFFISGCSSTDEKQYDLKRFSKELADLVGLPLFEQERTTQVTPSINHTKLLLSGTKNAYLAQEAHLMKGVSNEVINIYQQARQLMAQKKWTQATALFQQVISKHPNLSGSYVNQALIHIAQSHQLTKQEDKQHNNQRAKQLEQAQLWLDKAIQINSLNPYAHFYKGELLQQQGKFQQAEQYYSNALAIWPGYSQAQLNMAILLELYRGKLLEAYPYYSAYLASHGDDQQVQRWQAGLAIKIKRAGLHLPAHQGQ